MASSTIMTTDELPLVLTVAHVQGTMGISKEKAYNLVHRRDFPKILVGRAIRVPRDAFLRWLEAEAGENGYGE
jgi:excisionase family DNA binding protein